MPKIWVTCWYSGWVARQTQIEDQAHDEHACDHIAREKCRR